MIGDRVIFWNILDGVGFKIVRNKLRSMDRTGIPLKDHAVYRFKLFIRKKDSRPSGVILALCYTNHGIPQSPFVFPPMIRVFLRGASGHKNAEAILDKEIASVFTIGILLPGYNEFVFDLVGHWVKGDRIP